MRNISTTRDSNNTKSLASSALDFTSKAEGTTLCSAFALEAVLIVVGNLLTVVFIVFNNKLRKKSLFLIINMAFADVMLGAVTLPLYVYLWVGPHYQLWTNEAHISLSIFYNFYDTICSQASLISAVFISCERFYAIYWPLKHRTLSKRTYRIVIFVVWTLAFLCSAGVTLITFFISSQTSFTVWTSYPLIFLFIVCGCNVGIWRKFQRGNIASQHRSKVSQNERLTKTLLFVSAIAVLSWLPLIIANFLIYVFEVSMPQKMLFYFIINIINYSNSFVNPFVYAFRIPEFKKVLGMFCLRNHAVTNRGANERRDNRAAALTPVMQLRTLPTDPSHTQLALQQEVKDTLL